MRYDRFGAFLVTEVLGPLLAGSAILRLKETGQ
jgi:hypothetical protein